MTTSFTQSGHTQFFCKEECKEEGVLIETTNKTAQRGRYTIEYSETYRGEYLVSVTITNVTKSDSGLYRIGLKYRTYSYDHVFKINVEDGKFHENVPSLFTDRCSRACKQSGKNFRSPLTWVFARSLHRSKSYQTAPLKDRSPLS